MSAYGTPDTYPYEEIERECPKCGKKSKGKFCSYCGAALEKAPETNREMVRRKNVSIANPIFRKKQRYVLSAEKSRAGK